MRFGNNGVEYALGHGISHRELSNENFIEVNKVYYIPSIAKNFIYVNKLTNDNILVDTNKLTNSFVTRHPQVEVMSSIVQDKNVFTF